MAGQKCTGHSKRSGCPCKAWAIKGGTVCVRHGGVTPQVRRKANERIADEKAHAAVCAIGHPRTIDPHAALLEEVHRTAGHVQVLAMIVAEIDKDRLVSGITRTIQDPDGKRTVTVEAAYNVWYRLYMEERRHLLIACRTAIACGVEQARVELQERQGALIADVFRAVFADETLGLSADQRRQALARAAARLRLIDGGRESA